MYEAPKHSITADSIGKMVRNIRYKSNDKRTTLVDDNVRVYKGGSWRDRAYWLDQLQEDFSLKIWQLTTLDLDVQCLKLDQNLKRKLKRKSKKNNFHTKYYTKPFH